MKTLWWTYVALVLCTLSGCTEGNETTLVDAADAAVEVIEDDQGFLFKEADSDILFYQRAPKSFDGAYTRNNYIHPLWSLDSEILTEDGPPDHLHQRGVFWTWHQTYAGDVRLGDGWACSDFVWEVVEARIEDGPGGVKALAVKVMWKSPDWVDESGAQKRAVEEKTRIVVHPKDETFRLIDFEISLRALEVDVRIGGSEDAKGYGGFSARIRMPDDLTFVSSKGEIEPQTEAVQAGPWIDFVADFGGNGKKSGLAILVHPSNPGETDKWVIRQRGSMQNPVYPGQHAVPIPKDGSTVLKYRLVVHRGTTGDLDLAGLYEEYAR